MLKSKMNQPEVVTAKVKTGRLWRWSRRLFRIALVVYLGICAIAYFAQDWLAFPGMMAQGKPESRIQYGGDAQTIHLTTADGTPIAAVLGVARKSDGTDYQPDDDRDRSQGW